MEATTADGKKGGEGNNQVRAQWIANLKKKSMATEGGLSPPTLTSTSSLPLHHHDHHMQQQHACMLLATENLGYDMYSNVKVEPKATVDILPKKWIKPLLKKRNNALDMHSGPKPRTPRRKLNCGNAFEEMHIQTSNQHMLGDTAWGGFLGVGTPSAHYYSIMPHHLHPPTNQPHATGGALLPNDHLFGPDMDFGCNFDTFLDLPTPKSAEMPSVVPSFALLHDQEGGPHRHHDGGRGVAAITPRNKYLEKPYQPPPALVRTSSVEQEGLSYCLGQTRLHSSSSSSNQDDNDDHRSSPEPQPDGATTNLTPRAQSSGCIFDHNKHPELEGMFDYEFNDDDIDKEVDNFYMADGHELEIDLIA
ncbi:hypothetical protein DYB25_004916 [Aphanomyces astaci]|uniref:Uncharacterized protein n=1 Tax=Aphanomyces astaci TaxID=112090 RepID=A0A397BGL9_APHAT|nr:hypothetical protein DYB25_004916 [Aphanomyces astaci]